MFYLYEAQRTFGNENGSLPWHKPKKLRQELLFHIQISLIVVINLAEKMDIKLLYYIKHNNKHV